MMAVCHADTAMRSSISITNITLLSFGLYGYSLISFIVMHLSAASSIEIKISRHKFLLWIIEPPVQVCMARSNYSAMRTIDKADAMGAEYSSSFAPKRDFIVCRRILAFVGLNFGKRDFSGGWCWDVSKQRSDPVRRLVVDIGAEFRKNWNRGTAGFPQAVLSSYLPGRSLLSMRTILLNDATQIPFAPKTLWPMLSWSNCT